ncbi:MULTISPECIES: ABC transporter permease [Arthrobacter]|jgi:putative spermidine/putrescine transport system permease protein|uniref:Spermidine/putrescine transport system permease protein n=1 Tax=Arthrobacter bambusae TaxID=1338426 RepID=A0AAW8DKE5_9MICC|nr:ABC transporter permease subunit [Arthrobacter bambusae]MDP9907185.1 putative spermidine/putrescine transport system permease protein [Arthrobacter bambusae]MDQ0131328.1 putative spermidine/putrescine transport system permease protein [Arthrobacter bambusae]MDQ0182661.1 putative spermidine/putrescine transport system permease protein [Arthrobacter bambusae]
MALPTGSPVGSRTRRPLTLDSIVRSALVGLFVVLMIVFILGPLLWLGVRAFAGNWTFPNLLPDDWTLRWWQVVVNDGALGIAVQNSLFFAPLTVLVSAIICLPAAYAFARFDFPGRRFFLISLFATNAFPKMGLFVTLAALFYALNLMNTVLGILVVHVLGTVVFMTWIPAAAFAAVPRNLEEAARDAGASTLRVFTSVTLPMALPGIIVAAVMSFLASFDEAQGTYLVGAPAFMTMPTQMYSLVLNYPTQVAAVFSILLAIPSVALMLAAHKHILGGQLAEGFQIK